MSGLGVSNYLKEVHVNIVYKLLESTTLGYPSFSHTSRKSGSVHRWLHRRFDLGRPWTWRCEKAFTHQGILCTFYRAKCFPPNHFASHGLSADHDTCGFSYYVAAVPTLRQEMPAVRHTFLPYPLPVW